MERLDQRLTDEVTRAVRDAVREEMRGAVHKRRRTAALYAGSALSALYAGAAAAVALGLVLALAMPSWGAALIVAALLAVAAYVLREAAKPQGPRLPQAPPMPPTPPPGT
ncbi:phage holin family protein [Streptomyces sp. VRA16 Mangrove soil]|uniref:phage holin family protein n=1 Tax=Streptomyces sp. VRA16 Mangrove soil TaxID=2817434 RepID=UPI001A9E27AF|nr:phage holin family protein [Streptomyces sp. VRA16 Mangrove soil]MBO1331109.1 phage holin family protein [Streptomyces sp. VRA16 Mangrove soil]